MIGLDVSLTCTGIAGPGWTAHARPRKLAGHARLAWLMDEVGHYLSDEVTLAVIEGPSYGPGVAHRHEDLAGLRVMVRHLCWRRAIPYAVVPPANRAMYATGSGRADKPAVHAAVAERYGIRPEGPARYDEADALALAAMGRHWLGHPLAEVPARHARALESCQWPTLPEPQWPTLPEPGAGR